MISSLYSLTLMIETLDRIDTGERHDRLAAIASACSSNLPEALTIYRQFSQEGAAQRSVRLYHSQLLQLHQKLYACCTPIEPDQTALKALEELLACVECIFKNTIDPMTLLPQHYQDRTWQYVDTHLDGIIDGLLQKEIPKAYLDELRWAIHSLFERGKIPYLQYHHQDYLFQLIHALQQLASDRRSHKNWPYRFLILMINFNFNHMGFFNRWKELYQSDPSYMENLLRFPKHFSRLPECAYDPNRITLLKLMCQYISAQDSGMQSAQNDTTELFIHSDLNGKELKLWMHLCVKGGISASAEKKEVALAFSKLVKTREGTLLSPHSLTKMDKGTEYAAAVSIRKKLKAMQSELYKLFPELDRS